VLGNVIIFNNMLSAMVLSPLILAGVYPRVQAGRMLYHDVMPELKPRPLPRRVTGLSMLIAGETGAWILGNLLSTGYWIPAFLPHSLIQPPYDKPIAILVSPFIFLGIAGAVLM
jgi:hypothetical protein